MIHCDKGETLVVGPALETMTEVGILIRSMADSLVRQGCDAGAVREIFRGLVDVSLDSDQIPDVGPALDLSFRKGD